MISGVDYLYISVVVSLHICLLLQLYYVLVVYRKLAIFKSPDLESQLNSPLSVIICSKNEVQNLKKNLSSILNQNYPNFEVIVVNDCSNDGTEWYLRDLSLDYKNLKIVTINDHPRFKHGKKFAVTMGIKAAQNENLVFTDADCFPESEHWLSLMQRNFDNQTDIVLGYSPYEIKGGFLNKFIRFETFYTAINYLSYALRGIPYMGVGRNLAYKKSLFFKGKGFASHMHILSGDDDLFVNQNANNFNTKIEIHPDSHMWSEPKKTIGSYFSQKLRHQGAGKAYKNRHKKMLTLNVFSGVLFYLLFVGIILINGPCWLIISVFFIRLISQIFVYIPVLKKLKSIDLIWWMPILDFIYYIYIILIGLVSIFRKKVEWK
jgi:glycosyltransferase involved in cell wall biosynthesis